MKRNCCIVSAVSQKSKQQVVCKFLYPEQSDSDLRRYINNAAYEASILKQLSANEENISMKYHIIQLLDHKEFPNLNIAVLVFPFMDVNISSTKPNLNITEIMKQLLEVKNFLKNFCRNKNRH
jgi:hypothetical protein